MNRRLAGLAVVTVAVVSVAWIVDIVDASGAPTALPQSHVAALPSVAPQAATREVQAVLASYGYTIAVDGVYGPQTTGVVKSWQRSNGLEVDGIAGPITRATLGLAGAATSSQGGGSQGPTTPSTADRSVEQIIRDVWPDELEAEALRIAWRESNYRPDVTSRTGCCHGVFQLHEIHLGWMADFGVTSVSQLFDADTNVRMAFELYRRNGWQPWRCC